MKNILAFGARDDVRVVGVDHAVAVHVECAGGGRDGRDARAVVEGGGSNDAARDPVRRVEVPGVGVGIVCDVEILGGVGDGVVRAIDGQKRLLIGTNPLQRVDVETIDGRVIFVDRGTFRHFAEVPGHILPFEESIGASHGLEVCAELVPARGDEACWVT